MPSLKNKFACLTDLPSMPVLLMEALQQINGKQDLTTLVDKVSQDPSMVVQILRIANSSFYGMSREIGSLREAVVLLGFSRIRDMLARRLSENSHKNKITHIPYRPIFIK